VKIKKRLSEALLATLLPIYGYFLTYRYEQGYCSNFDIPDTLIKIDLFDMIKVIGKLIPLILFLYFFFEISYSPKPSKNPLVRSINRLFLPILFIFVSLITLNFSLQALIIFLIIILFFIFAEFILPLISARKVKGYKKKLEYQEDIEKKQEWLVTKFLKQLSFPAYLILFLSFFSLLFIDSVGSIKAKNQKSFLIIKSKPELVILRKYSDILICTTFNRKNKEVHNNFYLKSISQIANEGLQIIKEEIGPLKVHKNE